MNIKKRPELKIGTRFTFTATEHNCSYCGVFAVPDTTIGKEYVISGDDGDEDGGLYFIDDAGEESWAAVGDLVDFVVVVE